MALNGTFYGTTSNAKIKPKIVWSAVQDIAGNYTDVTATLSYSRTNTGYTTAGKWAGSITIDGTQVAGSRDLSITYNSDTLAMTATVRVHHDSYGAKTLSISAAGGISVSSMKETDISAQITLDTIPRAAGVSAVNGEIGSPVTVAVDRKSTAFTHSLAYSFGGLSGYIDAHGAVIAQEEKMTEASVEFLLPESFYTQIPDDPEGVCTITCRTYSGDTLIGSSIAEFTATANRTLCGPEVAGTVEDINPKTLALTGDSAVLVAGQSTALCTVTAQAKNSASIDTKTVAGRTVTEDRLEIANIPQGSILFSATDSRGYSAQEVRKPAFIPYANLTCDPSVRRTDPTGGNALLTLKGKCYAGSFGASRNALTVTYQVGEESPVTVEVPVADDHSYKLTLTLTGLDYTETYPVTVSAKDALSEVTKELTVQKGIPVFDWGEKDFAFHVPVSGDFSGAFGGAHIRTVRLSAGDTLTIRAGMYPESARQSLFLFGYDNGNLINGVVGVSRSGVGSWLGSSGVSVAAVGDLTFTVTLPSLAYDWFTLISAEPFEIL